MPLLDEPFSVLDAFTGVDLQDLAAPARPQSAAFDLPSVTC